MKNVEVACPCRSLRDGQRRHVLGPQLSLDDSKVLASVNGEKITEKDYENYLQLRQSQQAPIPDKERERKVVLDELMDRVRAGMVELPEKQAEVFWLSCLEGLSHQQIADLMQVTPGEVRVLLHRARARLDDFLSQHQLREREGK